MYMAKSAVYIKIGSVHSKFASGSLLTVLKIQYVDFSQRNAPPVQACTRTYGGHQVPIAYVRGLAFITLHNVNKWA